MMYFMSTETLTEEYTKDHSLKEILETKFVLVSSRIKYPHCDNVIPSKLYDEKLIFAMYGDKDDYKIIQKGIEDSVDKIKEVMRFVTRSLINDERIVFLATNNEMKTGYLKVVAKVISDMFEYPVIDYKKDRKKDFFYDSVVVAKRLKFYEDSLIDFALSTEYGRRMALRLMNKKDMKKELKKIGMYSKTMSKSEMRDTLKVYFVERG